MRRVHAFVPAARVPGLPPLAAAQAAADPSARPFLGPPPTLAAITGRAREVRARHVSRREPEREPGLRELAGGLTAGVFAGQQVGLFTGPLLTLVKALAASDLAAALGKAGVPARAAFWAASEDHDLVEVSRFAVPGPDGPVELGPEPGPLHGNRRPVGSLPIEADVPFLLESARTATGPQADAEALATLERLHRGASYGHAFPATLGWLFGEGAPDVVDAARIDLKPILVPLAVRLVKERDAVARLLAERSAALTGAGLPLQVVSEKGALPLFALVAGERLLLREREGRLELKGRPGESYDPEEVVARFADGTWLPSFSALSRPLAASSLYPIAATILGPAEISYWAQALPLFDWAGLVPPVLVPRPMVALAGPAERRLLSRLDLPFESLLAGEESLLSSRGERSSGRLLDDLLAVGEEAAARLERLSPAVSALDPSLGKALGQTRENVLFAIGKLVERTRAAAGRADESFTRGLRRLSAALLPGGSLAERVYTPVPWLLRYGRDELVAALREGVRWDASGVTVVSIGGEDLSTA